MSVAATQLPEPAPFQAVQVEESATSQGVHQQKVGIGGGARI